MARTTDTAWGLGDQIRGRRTASAPNAPNVFAERSVTKEAVQSSTRPRKIRSYLRGWRAACQRWNRRLIKAKNDGIDAFFWHWFGPASVRRAAR